MILLFADFTVLYYVQLSLNICLQENLVDYTNLFSPNDYKNNNKTLYKYLVNMTMEN